MKTIRMEEMTYPEINFAISQGYNSVIVAIGSVEQHGPHLPTITDTAIGDELAKRIAIKAKNTLQAKSIPVGVSEHHIVFGGTISLKPNTLFLIIVDYVESLIKCGFEKIILLPSHGGNFSTVEQAIKECQIRFPEIKIIGYTNLIGFANFLNRISNEFDITNEESGGHAGENETSMMLFIENRLVKKEKFEPGYIGPSGENEVNIILNYGMSALTKNGVLGDPTKASLERGKVYLEKMTDFFIKELQLEEPINN